MNEGAQNDKQFLSSVAGAYSHIREILAGARERAYTAVNFAMVEAYWHIGKEIVAAQGGGERAEYGSRFMKALSARLTEEFGKGFTYTNLNDMRQFYLAFSKSHTVCGQSENLHKSHTVCGFSQNLRTVCGELAPIPALRVELSWSHYRLIMRVEDEAARLFYMDECAKSRWSTRQLERQINTRFYERLLSSRDKAGVAAEITRTAAAASPRDFIKDPYVLEFLDVSHSPDLYEKDLETALLNHLQSFLLELGRGFSFVARQKHISFDGRDFYIDLVFYHYILKCFVLIDLKVDDLTHQDLGQMQMYVNYYTRELMNEGDSPPVGIILCADKSDAIVKYTLPENNSRIFASKYQLYLPTEEELRQELRAEIQRTLEERP